jgi:hypothetical protein
VEATEESAERTPNPPQKLGLEEIVHRINRIGLEYVEMKRRSDRLEVLKSSSKAKAMEKYDDGTRTEAKIKRMAELDTEYLAFLEELIHVRGESEKLKIRYESYRNLFEARRSILSYKKAEMQLL